MLLLALGVLVLTDALAMDVDISQRGPVGPRTVPLVIGAACCSSRCCSPWTCCAAAVARPRAARTSTWTNRPTCAPSCCWSGSSWPPPS
ncbi:hypothetical protein ACFQVA_02165 [Actinomadura keratinilytica]